MITALPPLLLAAAITIWPAGAARRRLRSLYPTRAARWRLPQFPISSVIPGLSALLAWPLLGPAGAAAALLLTIVIRGSVRRRRAAHAALDDIDGLAESLRTMVAELRAGATPITAAESAAEDAPPTAAAILHSAAAAARLGGRAEFRPADPAGAHIARAWQLATHHGLPLADVLDSVRADLEQRARFTRQVDARMAGPRSSAVVLACLPALALLLGYGTGADPLAVLADTGIGQFLLLLGTALAGAGLRWSDHITRPSQFS